MSRLACRPAQQQSGHRGQPTRPGGGLEVQDTVAVFFDTIPHEPLIDAVAERVADGSVLRLIRLFLEALIQDGYRLVRPRAGTPQGGVMTPPTQ
jgi:RNA-directed DNA polymerase